MAPELYGESDKMKLCAFHYWALCTRNLEQNLTRPENSDSSGCGLDRRGVEGRARDLCWGWAPAMCNSRNMPQSFFHSTVRLTTGPQPLPQPVLHRVRSVASAFNLQYPLVSLKSSGSCLRLLPRLPVTSILLSVSPPIKCLRKQFVRKV